MRTRHMTAGRGPALRIAVWIGVIASGLLLAAYLARGLPTADKATGLLGPSFAYLSSQPFVLLFLMVLAGYALGRVKFGSFNLGATAATLILGLGLSIWASLRGVTFSVPDFAATLFFNIFMFAVGMKVGPQFLSGLRRDARAFISIGLLVPLLSIGLMFAFRALFDLGPGLAPGIFAGANTATPGLGAAKDVYAARGGDPATLANLSTGFAVGYCLSMVGFVLMMKVVPRLFGKDAKAEARAYQAEIESGSTQPLPGTAGALEPQPSPLGVRVFKVENPLIAGNSVAALRDRYPRVAIERLQRDGQLVEVSDSAIVQRSDVLVLSGPLSSMVKAEVVGPELADERLASIGMETVEVVVQGDRADGKAVRDVMATQGHGFHLNAVFRGGAEIPIGGGTMLQKGDVLRVTGSAARVRQLEEALGGRLVKASVGTDIATLALGLAVGAFLGTVPLPIPGVKLAVGSAVGLLLTGIVLSTLRTRNPMLGGPFPEPARQLLEDLGLNVFIAITALNAGAGVLTAVKQGAILPVVIGTVVVGFLPPLLGWVFGQYRHKMNGGLLMGAICGARCSSPGLRTAQEDTQSTVPALSYPVTFAISNVLVALGCYLLATMG